MSASLPVAAQVGFKDVTQSSGIIRHSESWGAAWGDWNGDLRPDFWVGNHRNRPDIFQNNGDGTFSNVTLQIDRSRTFLNSPRTDTHGAAWADFDNDGDQDLGVTTTGAGFRFMENMSNAWLLDQAWIYEIQDDHAGRLPVWFDFTRDGLLDVAQVTKVPAKMRQQNPGVTAFSDIREELDVSCQNNNYAQISDLDSDGYLEFICGKEGTFPQNIYSTHTLPFEDVTSIVPEIGNINDTVIADFNNDLRPDFFFTRGRLRPTQARKVAANLTEAWVVSSVITGSKGFSFQAEGPVVITMDSEQPEFIAEDVSIGHDNMQPAELPFILDPAAVSGMATNNDINIGYDTSTQTWTVMLAAGGKGRESISVYFTAGAASISNVSGIGLTPNDEPMNPKLLLNTGDGFQDAQQIGLGMPVSCNSVTTGDFDNDMDIDLYLVCRGSVENIANLFYENQGDGTFKIQQSHGAEGAIGLGVSSGAGTGESVVSADYDLDGKLDLLVTNGLRLMKSVRTGGPVQLFQNTTENSNHWVELDLVGTISNRDATGAKVIAVAGDVTQMREQNGGYHRWSQNDRRIHFGLGINTQVDIIVRWPNGATEFFADLQADQLYRVVEGGTGTPVVLDPVPAFAAPQPSDECTAPAYDVAVDRALFIWKDCETGIWSVRAVTGDNSAAGYSGQITATQNFNELSPVQIDASDSVVNTHSAKISFLMSAEENGEDGFDFSFPVDAATCFEAILPPGAQVLLGGKAIPLPATFDFENYAPCVEQKPMLEITGFSLHVSVNSLTAAKPGPVLVAGEALEWTYTVTNTGNTPLQDIIVSGREKLPVFGSWEELCTISAVAVGESASCQSEAASVAVEGHYLSLNKAATVTGDFSVLEKAFYQGQQITTGSPGLAMAILANNQSVLKPGPIFQADELINWVYVLTNTGDTILTNIEVKSRQKAPVLGNWEVLCSLASIPVGESASCIYSSPAIDGRYISLVVARASASVEALSRVFYQARESQPPPVDPSLLMLAVSANGQVTSKPGPVFQVGETVDWIYSVTNQGNTLLENIEVHGRQKLPIVGDWGILCLIDQIPAGEIRFCQLQEAATEGINKRLIWINAKDNQLSDLTFYQGQ
ncbi:MAG: CRTAC1 family protein [Gammaproteobacteria bacterium]